MVHYSCDACKRPIHPKNDVHHVVKIEIFSAVDDPLDPPAVRTEAEAADPLDDLRRSLRFDLCDACRDRFLQNPLGMAVGKQLDFSAN